ncbi:MAG: hypothetical protein PVI74_07135 [Syntrophobacterales bacterium]
MIRIFILSSCTPTLTVRLSSRPKPSPVKGEGMMRYMETISMRLTF